MPPNKKHKLETIEEVREVDDAQVNQYVNELQELNTVAKYQEFISKGECYVFFSQGPDQSRRAAKEFAKGVFTIEQDSEGQATNVSVVPIRIGIVTMGKVSDEIKGCFWYRPLEYTTSSDDILAIRYTDGVAQRELPNGIKVAYTNSRDGMEMNFGLSRYFSWTDSTVINEDIGSLFYPGIPQIFKNYYKFIDAYVEDWLKA
ncbi:hypothetical protein GGI20_000976 [Coemansia sp. BCRC 34301]|nr:hypothetical protein GGI20_000976 [Coemansia sp. BCRC 34301]